MGQRSRSEAVVGVFQAFLRQRTWRQPLLARELELQVPALKKLLDELVVAGVPLERDEEAKTEVFWSVPKNWFPGGAVFQGEDLAGLMRLLARLPESDDRNRLLDVIAENCAAPDSDEMRAIIAPPPRPIDDAIFKTLFESASQKIALHCHYYSASKRRATWRYISVQRLIPGHERFAAICHREDALRWWRTDGLLCAELAPDEPFRAAPAGAIDDLIASSVGGFETPGPVRTVAFFVADSDAEWVKKNLPEGLHAEDVAGGVRIVSRTAAVEQVARYVLWLGGLARPETPELTAAVAELAGKVLAAC